MSHRNTAYVTTRRRQLTPVAALAHVRNTASIAIISLVLVLLITNGGAG